MLNITAVGRLGKDPELRTTQSGQEITSFTLAVNIFAKGEQRTEWLKCSIWGKRGDAFRQYVTKGQQVTITGKAFHDTWMGKDGEVNDFCVDVQDCKWSPREQPQEQQCSAPALDVAEIPF